MVTEEDEARRKGLNALITHLKKHQKTQTRRETDLEVRATKSLVANTVMVPSEI